jgi:hypothetical protein
MITRILYIVANGMWLFVLLNSVIEFFSARQCSDILREKSESVYWAEKMHVQKEKIGLVVAIMGPDRKEVTLFSEDVFSFHTCRIQQRKTIYIHELPDSIIDEALKKHQNKLL